MSWPNKTVISNNCLKGVWHLKLQVMPDDLKKNKILLLIYGQITAVTWAFILESLSFDHQYCYPIQNHKLSLMDCTKAVSCHTQFCEIWLFLSHPISLALAYKSCASLI